MRRPGFDKEGMNTLRLLAFAMVAAVISTVASERLFWFWTRHLRQHGEVALFYTVAVLVTFWAIGRYGVNGWWSLLLATPLYAYVTEGVITPVMYTGGPFVPFFPLWFSFWHGILAMALVVFAIRRWLLDRAYRALSTAAVGFGAFWGLWASTLRLPENLEDPELLAEHAELVVLEPAEFGIYVATFTAVLAAGHWALGFLWPAEFSPGRWMTRIFGFIVVAWAAMWSVVVPWALPMFLAYGGLQLWGLRRHRAQVRGPDLFAQLQGRVQIRTLWPLGLIVPAAWATYGTLWLIDPSVLTLQWVFYGSIAIQTIAGAALGLTAFRRSGRRSVAMRSVGATELGVVPGQGLGRHDPYDRSFGS